MKSQLMIYVLWKEVIEASLYMGIETKGSMNKQVISM